MRTVPSGQDGAGTLSGPLSSTLVGSSQRTPGERVLRRVRVDKRTRKDETSTPRNDSASSGTWEYRVTGRDRPLPDRRRGLGPDPTIHPWGTPLHPWSGDNFRCRRGRVRGVPEGEGLESHKDFQCTDRPPPPPPPPTVLSPTKPPSAHPVRQHMFVGGGCRVPGLHRGLILHDESSRFNPRPPLSSAETYIFIFSVTHAPRTQEVGVRTIMFYLEGLPWTDCESKIHLLTEFVWSLLSRSSTGPDLHTVGPSVPSGRTPHDHRTPATDRELDRT